MNYFSWFTSHASKHKAIIKKLLARSYTQKDIIAYFDFEAMVVNEPDFCPLYAENRKCHDMKQLNCYLCACPNFRFDDTGVDTIEGKTRFSFCSIDSKEGKVGVYGENIHQDCSGCGVPHKHAYVERHFDLEWFNVMKACSLKPID